MCANWVTRDTINNFLFASALSSINQPTAAPCEKASTSILTTIKLSYSNSPIPSIVNSRSKPLEINCFCIQLPNPFTIHPTPTTYTKILFLPYLITPHYPNVDNFTTVPHHNKHGVHYIKRSTFCLQIGTI